MFNSLHSNTDICQSKKHKETRIDIILCDVNVGEKSRNKWQKKGKYDINWENTCSKCPAKS
jgi:hypothetical protein